MSSKDNKPDLSNLKSRLGLNKSGDDSDESSDPPKDKNKQTPGSGAQATVSPSKDKKRSKKQRGGGSKKKGGAKRGGDADDRLAALKKSKLKSKKKQKTAEPSSPKSETSRSTSSDGFDEFDEFSGGAKDTGGSTGARASEPQSSGPSQRGSSAPSGKGRSQAGPPPGAQGPPPTAMAPPTTKKEQPSASAAQIDPQDDEDIDLADYDLDDQPIFSPAAMVVMASVLVIGLLFGFFASSSLEARSVQQSRVDDAQNLQADLEPVIEDFDRAEELVEKLVDDDPTEIDFEAAEELAQLNFAIDPRILPRERMLMADQRIVGPLNRAIGYSQRLENLVQDHYQLTTIIDRDELESFAEEVEGWDDDVEVAVRFDLLSYMRHWQDWMNEEVSPQQFDPPLARLVEVDVDPEGDVVGEEEEEVDGDEPRWIVDEEGMTEVRYVTTGAAEEVHIYDVVPVRIDDFLSVDTNNALDRYRHRISRLREYVEDMGRQLASLEPAVEEVAQESVPLFSIGSTVDDEADHEDGPEVDEPAEPLEEDDEE